MPKPPIKCTFCKKPRTESHKMVVSGEVAICDSCLSLFSGLVKTNPSEITKTKPTKKTLAKQLNPLKIREHLDHFVVGQEPAKIAIAVSVVNHYKRMLYTSVGGGTVNKNNLLITGPSGSGKSLLISSVAKFLDVPFITVDATTLTEAGYIGQNVDTIISRLLVEADGDPARAEQGIVFIDEVDKIALGKNRSSGDNKVSGIQSALLKMIEGSSVPVGIGENRKTGQTRQIEIQTQGILFICGGAFVGLDEIVKNRLKKKSSLGFVATERVSNNLESEYTTEDFIEFGMIPEFMGRLALRTWTRELTESELADVLTRVENNLLDEYRFYFGVDGIEIAFTEDFIQEVARRAKNSKTGVRGLRSICERVMLNHLYLLPEYQKRRVAKMTFGADCVDGQQIPTIEVYAARKKNQKNS